MSSTCANPQLLQWVKEWMDEASGRNSKGFNVYKKAYDALKTCPMKFKHPSEAQQLNGIGPKLSDRLTAKLKAHCAATGQPSPEEPQTGSKRHSDNEESTEPRVVKKPRKAKPYVPTLRSGAYALILALATLNEDASIGLTKADTIDRAQPHCDTSFTAPSDPTKFYTAWNSMKTLVGKDLVYEHGRPLRRYMLTEDGWEVARRMKAADSGSIDQYVSQKKPSRTQSAPEASTEGLCQNVATTHQRRTASHQDAISKAKPKTRRAVSLLSSSPLPSSPPMSKASRAVEEATLAKDSVQPPPPPLAKDPTTTSALPNFTPILLPPGSFTVHLLLDSREIRTKHDRDYISHELSARGITPITRSLPLTDALWIARVRSPSSLPPSVASLLNDTDPSTLSSSSAGGGGDGAIEIVLPHALERKRLDDLISSIKDGRFHEQKFRLRRSGLRHITYLIEDFGLGGAERSDRYGDAVASAIASTQVVNGYFVKRTGKLDESIAYLARMTRLLKRKYEAEAAAGGLEIRVVPSEALEAGNGNGLSLSLLGRLRERECEEEDYKNKNKEEEGGAKSKSENKDKYEYCITYPAFSALVSKSATLCLRDVYLKMLMCTRGVTGEKAVELQKRWSTPRGLVEALEEAEEKEREKEGEGEGGRAAAGRGRGKGKGKAGKQTMISDRLGGSGSGSGSGMVVAVVVPRKKIARGLSGKIADVWG